MSLQMINSYNLISTFAKQLFSDDVGEDFKILKFKVIMEN